MAEKKMTLEDYAIQSGIENIVKARPDFAQNIGFIAKHIDRKNLRKKLNTIQKGIDENWAPEKAEEYVMKELSDYITSGALLDEVGQKVILGKGLEGKTKEGIFSKLFSKKTGGQNYLNKIIDSFGEIYELFKTGDYAQRMPELAESATTIKDAGFMNSTIELLNHYGLVTKEKYNAMQKAIKGKITGEYEKAVSSIENYLAPQKVVASAFGIIGALILIFSGIEFTGAAIGLITNTTAGFITGFISILTSGVLSFVSGK